MGVRMQGIGVGIQGTELKQKKTKWKFIKSNFHFSAEIEKNKGKKTKLELS